MANNPRVAKSIRALRTELDMTQAEFAKAVGAHQTTVSKWEHGETPRTYQAARIAQACKIDFDVLTRMWIDVP